MSQRDFSENEPDCTPELPVANRALFLEKVRQSNEACQNGDFTTAVALYTDALALDPTNYIIYSNRSAARLKQGQFALSLQDATKAKELCPQWAKAYFRQGVALQCLGRYGEALAAFSSGLAQDVNSKQMLSGLIEASIKSPLRNALEPTFHQLCAMKLDQSPFVVISVIGQELLQAGQYHSAVTVLESALRIGTCSLKLRGSVFSALSSAYWALNQLDKAIGYMQQDLAVAKSLGDSSGECRAHGNLGSAYFSKGSYKEALTAHRYQLVLAMKFKDSQAAASALTSLGHVYTAIADYSNALASHKQCVQLVKQMGDRLQEAREIGNVGAVYLAQGDFESAQDCHTKHLRLARKLNNQVEEARAYSNLGSLNHFRRNFSQAIVFHEQVLRIAQQLGDKSIEARAYAGLGHAARCSNDFTQAKRWHEKQLEMALSTRDKIGEARACSNLGIVHQLIGDYDAALKLHQAHLTISRQMGDRAGIGRAFGNIGNAYSAAGLYEEAIKYHKQELTISKEVRDRSAEASTHGNLAVTYQSLGSYDMALIHYRAHLTLARELKDTIGEATSLLNLGNCLSSRQEFSQAIPYYEQYLMLSQELGDIAAEGKACHFLGFAHYSIRNYRESVRYYDQDLALAKDLQDKMNMGRAYCNLGLAHLGLNNTSAALECQKYFLAIAHMTNHLPGKFRALGNIGDVLIRTGEIEESAKMYQRQLALAKQYRERAMEATSYGALGLAHRLMKKFDKALGYHTQELTLRQEICDLLGEARAHGHLGAVHIALGNYNHAINCYREQLDRAHDLNDKAIEAQAYGNLGIAKLNSGHYEDAISNLELQLGTLEQVNLATAQHDRARAFGLLGDCYDALGDIEESINWHEKYLQLAIALQSPRDQERAYCGLGHSYKNRGDLKAALVCLEKRLVFAHELNSLQAKAQAYFDLGKIHCSLGNNEQSISCFEHQRNIAQDLGDRYAISDSTSSLGQVLLQMKNFDGALKLHLQDKELCESLGNSNLLARAMGNLGTAYESLRNYNESIRHFERQLQLASDRLTKAFACESLGRVFHVIGETAQAINYLRQGLVISQSLNKSEEEAKIRQRLGLVLIDSGDNENARTQLETAAQILESVRFEQRSPEAKQHLYDLQTNCYHLLQKILVSMGKNEEALVAAERCKSRASLDTSNSRKTLVTCTESIFDLVNKSKTNIIYFSLANDELYTWFLQPQKRIVRFNAIKVNEMNFPLHSQSADFSKSLSKGELLESYISMLRDDLGVNSEDTISQEIGEWRSSENLLDDFANERAGFLRMVNRNHLLNSSNYSLSSLFSLGSVGGSVASLQGSTRSISSLQGSTRSRRGFSIPQWQGPSSLHALYNLLLAPFEDLLPSSASTRTGYKELILVLENELYLIPFAVLRSGQDGAEYLSERCSLLTVPSLQTLRQKSRMKTRTQPTTTNGTTSTLVVGPRIPVSLTESQGWTESTASLQEAAMVSDMLQAKTLVASNATKNNVITELATAECVHFAAALSWKVSGVVLSPGDMMETPSHKRFYPNDREGHNETETEDEGNDVNSNGVDIPPLNDFILTSDDINSVKLNAKLIVLSAYNSLESISGVGVANLASAWLRAGAGAVLLSLWPVPETAAKILLRAFYSALLQGARAARALAEAMQTVQHTKHFAHPSNWAGFLLIGGNVRLSNKVALIGQALCELVKTPEKCRDALRVCLHLVEKSLQRIHRGQKNAMYTTQKSIDNKAGSVNGWKDLLMAVGFRFEPAANGIPSSVFFPQTNPDERLSQCSASLQALLALSPTTLHALSKLVNNAEIADDIIGVMRNVVSQYPPKGNPDCDPSIQVEVPLSVRLWRVSGCHELLASLGFDLMEVGQDEVTLRTGKQANRRNCQFVLQALLALFDTHEAPKSLGIDSSSSCESLNDEKRPESHSNSLSPIPGTTTSSQQRSISPVGTVKSLNLKMPRPTLPTHPRPLLSSGSAFTSYVRKRGEPDGGRTDVESNMSNMNPTSTLTSIELNTDSDISDSYSTQTVNRFEVKAKMSYSSLRAPIKVGRPGGGGESDAAFTPSPPITLQNVENNVSIALAHQTRIRNLYSASSAMNAQCSNEALIQGSQRPDDSSSSASSTNDWDGSGHATVLRRAQQMQPNGLPPMPPPRQTMPLVDTLRSQAPLATVYNNLSGKNAIESTSSDSEFEKMYESRAERLNAQKSTQQQFLTRKIPEECLLMDRLSVRTENTTNLVPQTNIRKQMQLQMPDDETQLPFKFNANNLYFSSSDSDVIESQHKDISLTLKANSAKENNKPNLSSHNKNIQDLILRKINREMTPTISDVYHERTMDLGLAPPLSKLLLSKNYEENDSKTNTIKKASSSETVSDINLSTSLAMYVSDATKTEIHCETCKHPPEMMCQCKTGPKKLSTKPWMNNLNGTTSTPSNDLNTVDTIDNRQIAKNSFNGNETESNSLENETNTSNISANTLKRGNSPYSDLSKRDEGDGRSVADSQCSGNYKSIDLNANSKLSQVQQRINKFNMNSSSKQV